MPGQTHGIGGEESKGGIKEGRFLRILKAECSIEGKPGSIGWRGRGWGQTVWGQTPSVCSLPQSGQASLLYMGVPRSLISQEIRVLSSASGCWEQGEAGCFLGSVGSGFSLESLLCNGSMLPGWDGPSHILSASSPSPGEHRALLTDWPKQLCSHGGDRLGLYVGIMQ